MLEDMGNVMGNRYKAVLSAAFSWGMRHGWCEGNPALGVKRNRERGRSRVPTPAEVQGAKARSAPEFAELLEAAALTGRRQGDLIRMMRAHCREDCIEIREGKGGGRLVQIYWSDALRACVERAKALHASLYVFTNTRGERWTGWGVQSAMRRLDLDWTFHDLRRHAESYHPQGMGLLPTYGRIKRVTPVR
jgi:hypothetical protein